MPATIDCCVASEKNRAPDKKDGFPSSRRPSLPNLAAVDGDFPGCALPDGGVKVRPPLVACPRARPTSKYLLRAARKPGREPEDIQSPGRASRFPCLLRSRSWPARRDRLE